MAMAGGFSLNEQSASAMGTANAGAAANPQNASTVIFNPAGMTQLSGTNLSFGAAVLDIDAEADSASATNQLGQPVSGTTGGDIADPAYLPSAFLTHEMSENVAVGVGLHAPYGLAADYDDDFTGRYFADETELTGIALTPSIAVDSGNGLSLGVGVNIMYLDGKLSKFADTSGALYKLEQKGAISAQERQQLAAAPTYSNVEGDTIEYTLRIGALYELSDRTQFGLTAETGTGSSLEGDITISDFPTQNGLTTLKEEAEVPLDIPPSVTFGARHQLNDDVTLLFGATWARWSDFEELDIYSGEGGTGEVSSALRAQGQVGNPITHITEKWQDTWQYNLGATWQADPQWKLKAGYAWDESPVDSYTTARIPSQDRHWLTLGAQFAPANTDWTVDAAVGTLIFDGDAKVNEREYTHAQPTTEDGNASYTGSYDLSAWSASVELSRSF
ncbi:aromatic hydrocarbon degradation protein [Halovibrio salipaludis]|uniref:Aromatic hydrocarbon degradation protein n=2 Tax=Halovibrio salipaludis TaxID=2032626 RepID=A0A2A2F878_9GAMM|nr:aromatic hydrocarbon degradation protein [Halovibrio salipaludis]